METWHSQWSSSSLLTMWTRGWWRAGPLSIWALKHTWAKKDRMCHFKGAFLTVSFPCSPEGICVGSGRDNHCLPFSAHGLLRTEIWQGKITTLTSPAVCYDWLCFLQPYDYPPIFFLSAKMLSQITSGTTRVWFCLNEEWWISTQKWPPMAKWWFITEASPTQWALWVLLQRMPCGVSFAPGFASQATYRYHPHVIGMVSADRHLQTEVKAEKSYFHFLFMSV